MAINTRAPKTITTIALTGQLEFTIPFEYLTRRFVVVSLVGQNRKSLVLNTDYRFVNTTTISLSMNPDPQYTHLELRRVTSASDRLVNFQDGSILRAGELNVAQVQTLHVAEEARDLTLLSVGINEDNDLDAHGRRIVNLRAGVNPTDAVNMNQLAGTEAVTAQHVALAAQSAAQAAYEASKLGNMNALAAAVQVSLTNVNFLKPIQVNGRNIHSSTDRYYSPKADGTDESIQLQAAIDELRDAGGGKLHLPDAVMRCDEPLIGYTNMHIIGGPVTQLDFSHRADFMSTQDSGLFVFRGTATEPIPLAANAVKGTNKINVPDASIFAVGDLVEISMNDKGSYDDPSIGVKSGQLNRITGVYTSTNNLVLDTIIFDTLTVANSARVRLITPIENSAVISVGFKGKGRPTVTTQPGDQGLKFFYGVNVQATNCRFDGVDARSVDMVCCYGWRIHGCNFKFAPLGTIEQVSYGACYSSSYHGVISNNIIVNARHGVISSHLSSANTHKYYGVSRFVLITGNTVTGNYGDLGTTGWVRAHAGIATHTDAEFITIIGNTVSGCRYGINPRTWNIYMSGNQLSGNKFGLYLSESYGSMTFDNNIVTDCETGFSSPTTQLAIARNGIRITNNTFERCGFSNVTTTAVSKGLRISGNLFIDSVAASSSGVLLVKGPWQGLVRDNQFMNIKAIALRLEEVERIAVTDTVVEDQTGSGSAIYAVPGCKKVVIKDTTLINAAGISAQGADCHVVGTITIN